MALPIRDFRLVGEQLVMREYLRVSVDKSGRERSPEEQHHDHEYDADEQGWQLHGTPYREVGSASKFARKARAGFDRLIEDLENDRFGAHILGLWEGSRGSRMMSEWVRLVEALEGRCVLVWIHVRRRLYDPRNPHDRADLLSDAVKHELASAETSDRAKRASAGSARAGRPHGKLQRGYLRIYDPKTREFVCQEHDPEWAPLIAELFDRAHRRQGLRRIADDWEARGIVHSKGPFAEQQLRKMLLSPAYAGLRVVTKPDGTTSYVDGQWEGIVDKAIFFDIKQWLEDPSRKTTVDGKAKHVLTLSSAAACDVCDGPISSFNDRRRGEPRYKCYLRGHVMVRRSDLDQYALDVVFSWLSEPDNYAKLRHGGEEQDEELKKTRESLGKARQELKDLARRVGANELSQDFAAMTAPGIEDRIAKLESRQRELEVPNTLAALLGDPEQDVRARWDAMVIESQRATARLLFSPELIGQIRLMRSPRPRAWVPIEERVRVEKKA